MIQRVLVTILLILALAMPIIGGNATVSATTRPDVPVLAYYYIWFTPDSWNRAKLDLPLLGPYSSDDEAVMRLHVQWAKAVGIDGFIVSWKHTSPLSHRLAMLVQIAAEEDFKLTMIYEGLDFYRHPLPIDRISSDLDYFTATYGDNPVFDLWDKPVMIWSGTWKFSPTEIEAVSSEHRDDMYILGSQKQIADYEAIAEYVDGNAYYWSSVDPSTFPNYLGKLSSMSDVVHAHDGIWIAPAAAGFDARHLGGTREVTRNNGDTLTQQVETAEASRPDAIGLISWNEFSENSHIEPSCLYGDQSLRVTAEIFDGTAPTINLPCDSEALATAQAGAWVGPPGGTPSSSPAASIAPPSPIDWDSSAPEGLSSRADRFGTVSLLGILIGLTGFSMIKILRRSLTPDNSTSASVVIERK